MPMDTPEPHDRHSDAHADTGPPGFTGREEARLAALAAHLRAHRFEIELTNQGLRVRNPDGPTCCEDSPMRSDMITCCRRDSDGGRLWFFTSWKDPIAEADRVTDAVTRIKGYLGAA